MNDYREPAEKECEFRGDWSELDRLTDNLDFVLQDVGGCGPQGQRGERVYTAIEAMGRAINARDLAALQALAADDHCEGFNDKLTAWFAAREARNHLLAVISRFGRPDAQP